MDDDSASFFCNICGGPPTYRYLIKRSSLQYFDEENQLDEHEAYNDYCNCGGHQEEDRHSSFCNATFGYDARDISLKNIMWLGDVRLVTYRIPDAELFTEKDSADLPMATPLGQHVDSMSGHFFYPRPYGEDPRSNILECNKDGFLVHDTCLEILKQVYHDVISTTQPLDLRDFLSVMELGLEDRNCDCFDWGYGDTFSEGVRFEGQGWVPWENSEWTVMDPNGPFDLQPLIAAASTESVFSLSFILNQERKMQHLSSSTKPVYPDYLSLIPCELRLRILETLPTQSVLNLFIASPGFRQCAENLPRSFWESRLLFDVPWCAGMVLSMIPRGSTVQWHELLRLLKEASAVPGPDSNFPHYLALKNRRRVWLKCEQILKDIEALER